ncbi:amidohydrolase family protein [Diaphorobacter sp. HDW4A]|uniref:amidohydrolase n=1 Tax=Diaphorobacter sp. HDW4A TaxID=2714924 RepID=UPI00140A128E|nr:amidohydrolase [Diaphorobacter sp. HDW4A]QIL82714.1 amidohydrolase family protein [Diaphorobacter sp. HDW4A]
MPPPMPPPSSSASKKKTSAACAPRHIDNALLADGQLVRLTIHQGRFDAIVPMADAPACSDAHDLGGLLVLPLLVDGHLHLDKTLLGLPWMPHAAGPTRASRIETELRLMPTLALSTAQRAGHLIRTCVAHGTGTLRTHVDVEPQNGLKALEGVLEAREAHRDWAQIQIVAFPQTGVMRAPGTLELLDAAIAAGADLVGGMDPCEVDCDPAGQLNGIFAIAHQRGVGVDVHLHESDELGLFSIREICKRAKALGMQGRVTISHGFCLGHVNESKARATADLMATAGVNLVTHGAASHPLPPLALLREHGVTVFAGNDNVRDIWSPYGTGDALERASLIGWRADWRTDAQMMDAFDLVTVSAARGLGVAFSGIAAGEVASFFAVRAGGVAEAVAARPVREIVVREGRVLARGGVVCDLLVSV